MGQEPSKQQVDGGQAGKLKAKASQTTRPQSPLQQSCVSWINLHDSMASVVNEPLVAAASFLQGSNASKQVVRFLEVYLQAERFMLQNEPSKCLAALQALWKQFPPGDGLSCVYLPTQSGYYFGDPVCYASLRMMTQWALFAASLVSASSSVSPTSPPPFPSVCPWRSGDVELVFTIVLIGLACDDTVSEHACSPLSLHHDLHLPSSSSASSSSGVHFIFAECLALCVRYVWAISQGKIHLNPRIVHLPTLCVPVCKTPCPQGYKRTMAGLGPQQANAVWANLDADLLAGTDWWWVLYPSLVPPLKTDHKNEEFVTGGMGSGPRGSPCFISDDAWVLRRAPHMGDGVWTGVERRAYIPQWFQHELFHHIFAVYDRDFRLEPTSHSWHVRSNWPSDFVGLVEPDYYYETVCKRLLGRSGHTPLYISLQYKAAPREVWAQLTAGDLVGCYKRHPLENGWHTGRLSLQGSGLRWINEAGVSWMLRPMLSDGLLAIGHDCPYYDSKAMTDGGRGQGNFTLTLRRGEGGCFLPVVDSFVFNGENYARVPT